MSRQPGRAGRLDALAAVLADLSTAPHPAATLATPPGEQPEDLPLDEPMRAAHRWLEADARDVQVAFHRWIRPRDLAQVAEGPAPAS